MLKTPGLQLDHLTYLRVLELLLMLELLCVFARLMPTEPGKRGRVVPLGVSGKLTCPPSTTLQAHLVCAKSAMVSLASSSCIRLASLSRRSRSFSLRASCTLHRLDRKPPIFAPARFLSASSFIGVDHDHVSRMQERVWFVPERALTFRILSWSLAMRRRWQP
jgi:hypothetical protein